MLARKNPHLPFALIVLLAGWSAALPDQLLSKPAAALTNDRIRLDAGHAVVLRGQLILRKGHVYELSRELRVQDGTLVLEAGTRIEASSGASIVIERAGRIVAEGTATEPIVITCPGAQTGCWNGVIINGVARVNTGTSTSPVIAGRDAAGGCLEVPTSQGAYGGCQDNDSSGVFRHVWLQGAGADGGGALILRAVGSRTVVNNVQVLQSISRGVRIQGGTVNLRYLRVAFAAAPALVWSEGWRGRIQYGIVQARAGALAALEGGNLESNPDALPRSAPLLRNFTIIGPNVAGPGSGAAGVRLHSGTGATLQAFVVSNQPVQGAWVFDIDDDATWTRFDQNEIHFQSSLLVGFEPLGSLDDDPPRQGFFAPDIESQILREPSSGNRVIVNFDSLANQIHTPYGAQQDLRPRLGSSLFNTPCNVSTSDPFFDAVAYCGAIEPSSSALIPWNEPGPVAAALATPASPAQGYVYVLVTDSTSGPLSGVRVMGNHLLGVTDFNGNTRFYLPSGLQSYTLQNLPSGCADPGLFIINVPANAAIGQTANVQC